MARDRKRAGAEENPRAWHGALIGGRTEHQPAGSAVRRGLEVEHATRTRVIGEAVSRSPEESARAGHAQVFFFHSAPGYKGV